jgi:hypothetical protein
LADVGVPTDAAGGRDHEPAAEGGVENDAAAARKRIFVTNHGYRADLKTEANAANGVVGADKLCQIAAAGQGLGVHWKAWISGRVAGTTYNAIDRIDDVGPWYTMDQQTLLFENRAAMVGPAKADISEYEDGTTWVGSSFIPYVWTGTRLGAYEAPACEKNGNSWEDAVTGSDGSVVSGIPYKDYWSYSDPSGHACNGEYRLYCIEQ